jgi:hypothetical protein
MKRALLLIISTLISITSSIAQDHSVHFTRGKHQLTVSIGGQEYSTYHFEPSVAKAYWMPLRTPKGIVITRDFPIGNEIPESHRHDDNLEPHQRPLYFGHGNINGLDFWGEQVFLPFYSSTDRSARYGHMIFRKLEQVSGGADSGTLRAAFDLAGSDNKRFAEEVQEFVFRGDDNSRIIDCDIWIRANRGAPVKMGDTKEGTFAIRLRRELDSPPARMTSSTGGVGEPQIWGKRADWVDYSGIVDGQMVGVAIFDSPKGFRHPTWWHARGYGLFSANPFGWSFFMRDKSQDGSYTIQPGDSLHFRYRVVIHNGDLNDAHIADQYQQYAAGEK